jgi:hypothetical protein
MRARFAILVVLLGVALAFAVTAPRAQQNFDPKDFSGVWARFGPPVGNAQGGAPFREKGDDGFGLEVPPFTPEGQKKFDSYKPGYGRTLGTAGPDHIGRRRAVPPEQQNDPASSCMPNGLTRLILSSYFSTVEFVQAKDRIIQNFAWTFDSRTIWMDGRKLPASFDNPSWNGYSTGRWEGDTLVVDSYGFEESSWLDHFGYPHSGEMKLEERYRRIAPDRLELTMTINDPVIYTKPYMSGKKVFRLVPREESSINGWYEQVAERCIPADEQDFNQNVVAPR